MRVFKKTVFLLCFAFACLADAPRVMSAKVEPRWPWNGLVDITCSTTGVAGMRYAFQFKGDDRDRNQEVAMRPLFMDGGKTFASYADGKVKGQDGTATHRFTWDAAKECTTLDTSSFMVSWGEKEQSGTTYLVVDLSTGKSRSTDEAPNMSDDTCRTTELWLHWIPAGTFTMGSPKDELGREADEYSDEVQHEVTLTTGYWMGIFEVTQKQWSLIMGNNPSISRGETRPVEPVSYNDIRGKHKGGGWPKGGHEVDADSFLGKLRAKTGLAFDLPTEAQWEYACRAGTTTALNSGKNLTAEEKCQNMAEVGRYGGNRFDGKGGYGQYTEVGSYLPNAWGLYDMHGNVYEWCLDWYGAYPKSAVTDPQGPDSGTFRVHRGGNWLFAAKSCRSADRRKAPPRIHDYYIGFRVVLAP